MPIVKITGIVRATDFTTGMETKLTHWSVTRKNFNGPKKKPPQFPEAVL